MKRSVVAALLAVASVPAGAPLFSFAAIGQAPLPQGSDFAFQGNFAQGELVVGTAPAGTIGLNLDGKPIRFASDGRFLLGFDRDHTATALLEARLADGRTIGRQLRVAPRSWSIEHVRLARRLGLSNQD